MEQQKLPAKVMETIFTCSLKYAAFNCGYDINKYEIETVFSTGSLKMINKETNEDIASSILQKAKFKLSCRMLLIKLVTIAEADIQQIELLVQFINSHDFESFEKKLRLGKYTELSKGTKKTYKSYNYSYCPRCNESPCMCSDIDPG